MSVDSVREPAEPVCGTNAHTHASGLRIVRQTVRHTRARLAGSTTRFFGVPDRQHGIIVCVCRCTRQTVRLERAVRSQAIGNKSRRRGFQFIFGYINSLSVHLRVIVLLNSLLCGCRVESDRRPRLRPDKRSNIVAVAADKLPCHFMNTSLQQTSTNAVRRSASAKFRFSFGTKIFLGR